MFLTAAETTGINPIISPTTSSTQAIHEFSHRKEKNSIYAPRAPTPTPQKPPRGEPLERSGLLKKGTHCRPAHDV
jgi:hypothetical protein